MCTSKHKHLKTLQMLLRSIGRMYGLCFEGQRRWKPHLLLIVLLLLAAAAPTELGFFLGDTKAVLNGCKDHWTLQDRAAVLRMFQPQMTVCVDIRVVVPGAWVAFSYSSVHAPRPELGLEGDDRGIYGWLLQVRHHFPLQLAPFYWHRVCLRRDVPGDTFSLEVNGSLVAERTVIARAIPASGSLWLGCRPRDRQPGAKLGGVELYLFRVWADLDHHGICEDGAVIGWNSRYWGLTSPRARQRDPNLLCDHRRLRRETHVNGGVTNAFTPDVGRSFMSPSVSVPDQSASTDTTSPPVRTTSPANQISTSTQISPITTFPANQSTPGGSFTSGSPLLNCDTSQLCSNENAYFWVPVSVEAEHGDKTEQDVHGLVSKAFGCRAESGDAALGVTSFIDFCQGDRQLQGVEVSCRVKTNISQTTCDVLLLLSQAVSACELQREGDSALQQAGETMQVRITGEVERVGRNLCEDVEPSGGGFVRCTSTASLDDICQSNSPSKLTW